MRLYALLLIIPGSLLGQQPPWQWQWRPEENAGPTLPSWFPSAIRVPQMPMGSASKPGADSSNVTEPSPTGVQGTNDSATVDRSSANPSTESGKATVPFIKQPKTSAPTKPPTDPKKTANPVKTQLPKTSAVSATTGRASTPRPTGSIHIITPLRTLSSPKPATPVRTSIRTTQKTKPTKPTKRPTKKPPIVSASSKKAKTSTTRSKLTTKLGGPATSVHPPTDEGVITITDYETEPHGTSEDFGDTTTYPSTEHEEKYNTEYVGGDSRKIAMRKHQKKTKTREPLMIIVSIGGLVVAIALVLILVLIAIIVVTKRRRAKQKPKSTPVAAKQPRKMESEDLNRVKFQTAGPLVMNRKLQGPVKHALDNEISTVLKGVEFDARQNELVEIGSNVEVVEGDGDTTNADTIASKESAVKPPPKNLPHTPIQPKAIGQPVPPGPNQLNPTPVQKPPTKLTPIQKTPRKPTPVQKPPTNLNK
nr:expressed protein [Haemonchus contortus]